MKWFYRCLWGILFLLIVTGLIRLRFDIEVLNLLPDNLEVARGLKIYQQHFANAQELILTIQAPDAEQAESAARALAVGLRSQSNLVSAVNWQPVWLERPEEIAEFIAFLWLNQPPGEVAALGARLSAVGRSNTLAKTKDQLANSLSPLQIGQLSYDPYGFFQLPESHSSMAASFGEGQELFASADGTFRLLFVQAGPDITPYDACRDWLKEIKAHINGVGARADFPKSAAIGYTGRPAFVTEIAGGMEHDMTSSVGLTALIIAILFWLAHRRWIPMLWLLVLLALILLGTLGLGGLIFRQVNVVSLGFAAILLGLAVDYAVVHYQEAIASPHATIPEIRRAIGPSIFWAAVTTISAFLVLNLGGLPGLAQLGTLVAVGVGLSALVMLFAFLPPLFRDRARLRQEELTHPSPVPLHRPAPSPPLPRPSREKLSASLIATGLLVTAAGGILLSRGWPQMDRSANALRPRDSAAYAALDEIKRRMASGREPLWVLLQGRDEGEMGRRWERLTPILSEAVSNGWISSFTLPLAIWPRPEYQAANKPFIREIISEKPELEQTALSFGFTKDALGLMKNVLAAWETALARKIFWPTNATSAWILGKLTARSGSDLLSVGFVFPNPNQAATPQSIAPWANRVSAEGFIVSGWELLGPAILAEVQKNLWRVVAPMVFLILLTLFLAFKRATEILLSLAVLGFSGLTLLAIMHLAGWSWNLLNLMAIPLMLGAGVDYSIFTQLALRRHHGDLRAAYQSVGRALLLCGGTAAAGFGSLGLSTNAGMASLGQVCAVGIGANMIISVYLLPVWWHLMQRLKAKG